jgi:ribulose 1,5-bisphosphate synthetase/thiazole synthase
MFGIKKGAVAKAPVLGPIMGKMSASGKSAMQKIGGPGKPASAGGKKAK